MLSYHWQIYGLLYQYFVFNGTLNLGSIKNERTPSLAEEVIAFGLLGKSVPKGSYNASAILVYASCSYWPICMCTSFFFQQVFFAEIKSLDALQLVALFPIYTLVAILFNLVSGWALDKFGLDRIFPLSILVFAFILFYFVSTQLGLALGLPLAVSAGANSTFPTALGRVLPHLISVQLKHWEQQ